MATSALSKADGPERNGAPAPLTLAAFLARGCVCADLAARTKSEALAELARLLAPVHADMPAGDVVTILEAREALSSTGLEHGVAIPHGKWTGLEHVVGCFARSRAGIDFQALDGRPTHLFFLLMAPAHSTSEHLRALARVARLMKDAALRERLLQLESADELYRALMDADAHL